MAKIIKALYLGLFFFTPLIFTSFNSELFELPKMYFVYTLSVLIISFHLANYLGGRASLHHPSPLDIPLLLFLFSQIISTLISVDPHTSVFGYYSRLNGGLLSTFCYSFLYWILVIYLDTAFRHKIVLTFLSSGFLVAVFGILEHFGIDQHLWIQDVQSRVFSTLGQPNWLSAYLCLLLPFSLEFSLKQLRSKKWLPFAAYLSLFIIFYLCLLFTKSKSGIIAAFFSLGLIIFINFLKNRAEFIKLISISSLIVILSLSFKNPARDFLFPSKDPSLNSNTQTINPLNITPSQDIRKIVWQGAFDLWQKYPYFGTGVETYAYSYYWTRPLSHNLTSEWDFLYNKAHNEYLNFLATTGTFGLGTYLLLTIIILYSIIKKIGADSLSLPILSAFISLLITNFAGFSVVITSLFFFLLPAFLPVKIPPTTAKDKKTFLKLIVVVLALVTLQKTLSFYFADIFYAQSQSLDDKTQYQSALNKIKLSLQLRPDEPIYLSHAAGLESKLALTTHEEEHLSQAISLSNQALTISPANLNLWKERSQTFYYLSTLDSKYFPLAIDALHQVTKIAPTDAKTYYLLGKFYQSASLNQNALDSYEQALKLKPNYDHASFALGQIYFEIGDFSNAKKYFETTLLITPQNPEAQDFLNRIATSSAQK